MKVNSPIRSPIILGRDCGMTTRALAVDLTAVSGDLQLIHNKYRKVQHFRVKKYTVTQRLALKPFLFAGPIDQQTTSGKRLCGIWCLQTTLWSAVRGGGMPRREKRMKVNRKKTECKHKCEWEGETGVTVKIQGVKIRDGYRTWGWAEDAKVFIGSEQNRQR